MVKNSRLIGYIGIPGYPGPSGFVHLASLPGQPSWGIPKGLSLCFWGPGARALVILIGFCCGYSQSRITAYSQCTQRGDTPPTPDRPQKNIVLIFCDFKGQGPCLARAKLGPGPGPRFFAKRGPSWLRFNFLPDRSAAFFGAQLWSGQKSGSISDPKVDILVRGRRNRVQKTSNWDDFGSTWLRLGWKPAQMNPKSPRSLMDHFWTSFGLVFDPFWTNLAKCTKNQKKNSGGLFWEKLLGLGLTSDARPH